MGNLEKLNLGIVGAAGRGASFKKVCDVIDTVRIHSVCDTDPEGLERAAHTMGASKKHTEYQLMLEDSDLDAVVIATPMPYHASMAIDALKRNIHVLSEVPAGISLKECQRLVRVSRQSGAVYMMGENCTYMRTNQIVREIVRQGLFGTPYYAEGEYLHDLKRLNEITRWRRIWQTGVNGVTYGTHSLGPILQWMHGDRIVRVCCAGSGHHYLDSRGDQYENEESCVMLCQTRTGGLIKVRVDMISDRPNATSNYQLQGSDGCYESARAPGERNRIWLRSRSETDSPVAAHSYSKRHWLDLEDLADEFIPTSLKKYQHLINTSGHGGSDLLEIIDFVEVIRQGLQPSIGVHEAMDMTLPGLVSQQSISDEGLWLDVPDSRDW